MKKLKIYNSLKGLKQDFIPLVDLGKKDFVGIYTCGPTVYHNAHIGNMRTYTFSDILRNVIRNILGYKVKHIMNITDVGHLVSDGDTGEDKMEKGSKREGLSAWGVAKKYEKIFREHLNLMNIEDFDGFPRATDHIQEQIDMVKVLEEKGYTYKVPNDGIYMDTSKVSDYGKLIGKNYKKHIEGLNAGERIEMGGKRNPTDFALWKFSPKNEKRQMERDSPWGTGFPGWHIECTAMSCKYLGEEFDIHTGGFDLIPVHHTNEIAQAECVFDIKDNIKYWMHVKFLNVNGGKMSKSDGTFLTLNDILGKGFEPPALRYMFLNSHYRNFQDFTWDNLKSFQTGRGNMIQKLSTYFYVEKNKTLVKNDYNFEDIKNYEEFIAQKLHSEEGKKIFNEMIDALLDDLNTSKMISLINKYLGEYLYQYLDDLISIIFYLNEKVLRLNLLEEVDKILSNQTSYINESIPEYIENRAKERQQRKFNKDYVGADELRKKIEENGFKIIDSKDSYLIEKNK